MAKNNFVINDLDLFMNVIDGLYKRGNPTIRIMKYLLNHANEADLVFTTIEEIAKECKISPMTVQRNLKILQEKSFIERPNGIRGGVYRLTNPTLPGI